MINRKHFSCEEWESGVSKGGAVLAIVRDPEVSPRDVQADATLLAYVCRQRCSNRNGQSREAITMGRHRRLIPDEIGAQDARYLLHSAAKSKRLPTPACHGGLGAARGPRYSENGLGHLPCSSSATCVEG